MDTRHWKYRPFQCRYIKANALSVPPGEYGRKAKTQRNWREPAQAVEHVVQFDNKRETSPGFDIPGISGNAGSAARNRETGAAWLSSARVVRCTVKSGNERNPFLMLYMSWDTASFKLEEGEDDVKSAWLLHSGPHTCYNGRYNGLLSRKAELIPSKLVSVRIEVCNSTSWSWNR